MTEKNTDVATTGSSSKPMTLSEEARLMKAGGDEVAAGSGPDQHVLGTWSNKQFIKDSKELSPGKPSAETKTEWTVSLKPDGTCTHSYFYESIDHANDRRSSQRESGRGMWKTDDHKSYRLMFGTRQLVVKPDESRKSISVLPVPGEQNPLIEGWNNDNWLLELPFLP